MFEPVIKWSGSKRSQAENILTYFPKEIDTYYEPFCGGASVLRRLLSSDIKVTRYVCSDLNNGLIDLWNEIINNPERVSSYYKKLWNELNQDDDKQRKKEYFATVRERYKYTRGYKIFCEEMDKKYGNYSKFLAENTDKSEVLSKNLK